MLLKQCFIIAISSVLLACAATPDAADEAVDEPSTGRNDCIHKPSIRGYTVLDEQNLIIEASGGRNYHVVLRRRAQGLRHSLYIDFDTTTSRVCARFDGIRYDDGMNGVFGAVRIASIQQLTQEEEEHLLIQYGKKEPEIEHTPAPQDVSGAEVEELDEDASE